MGIDKASMAALQQSSLLDAGSASYLEQLYDLYLQNPEAIPLAWQEYFAQLPEVAGIKVESRHLDIQQEFRRQARHIGLASSPYVGSHKEDLNYFKSLLLHEQKQTKVRELIDAYRLLGHLHAEIDPLQLREKPLVPELMLSYYHLTEQDLNTPFETGSLPGHPNRPLKEIIEDLKQIYCLTLASEFMHISDSPERIWVQEQVENRGGQAKLPPQTKQHIFERITAAEGLEKYLGAKYPGAKRFSLEGTDSLLVALDTVIQQAGSIGAKEIIIGMAHRGRLNVLVNLLGKTPNQLFDQFEGKHYDEALESGDVKYHQGFSSDVSTSGGQVHLSVAFNPSHLEIVAPVVCGSVKARQERRQDKDFTQVLSIVIHGDAAFSGQGVVMETLNMAQTRGFSIGGTLHIIINNQIGFTTSEPKDARSTLYCSDIGKMMGIPIFHVNANDPEAVFKSIQLAIAYRIQFKKDVIIDLIGYRRHGHNEADEPAATQPIMYQLIRKLPTVSKLYADKLISEKVISQEDVDRIVKTYREDLESRKFSVVRNLMNGIEREFKSDWRPYTTENWRVAIKTGIELETLKTLADKQTAIPEGFVLHARVQKIVDDRRKMTNGELPIDWGYAETLSYATLLNENYLVRLSGQDVGRGTFFHRHAIWYNQTDGTEYTPLNNLSDRQAPFYLVGSLLSEAAVLGFEYGFSQSEPKGLVLWEAQFGDFANNAQGLIDQFISSGEQKWGRLSGLTLLLPHGYEGQGAEHSSARLERFLQLCAEQNIQVCVPTTPAQMFHLLRRQVLRPIRKPLIVMTPKSLLRHKLATSLLQELVQGAFLPVLPEIDQIPATVTRVILCSGKVYYDLLEKRRADQRLDVAILRIEQLYPFPDNELLSHLQLYTQANTIVWCQEEPKNQGAWENIQPALKRALRSEQQLQYAGRHASAAPAVGYLHLHQEQQSALIQEALG